MAVGEPSRQSLRLEPDRTLTHEGEDRLIESDAHRREAEFIGSRLGAFESREQVEKREIADFGSRDSILRF